MTTRSSPAAAPSPRFAELLFEPQRAVPRFRSRPSALRLIGFPAVSGIFVAYTVARGLAFGDAYGFAFAAGVVVLGGAVLGVIALWFAGSLPNWSVPLDDEAEAETAKMFVLFSEATWPFLPLLFIVVPLDLYFHGTNALSASRGAVPGAVVWLDRVLVLGAIALWLVMLVRGTAVARRESEARAARELLRWGAELLAIAVLLGLILAASLLYW
ncbi:MAG TPA: hypothetical protein VFZ24_06300 [Longimicrobiales bacterium]